MDFLPSPCVKGKWAFGTNVGFVLLLLKTSRSHGCFFLGGMLFDPSKCSKLSMDQKRQLVYEVSNWSGGATDILHTWGRQELLHILCAELGKERKYTGFTRSKIIERLLKVVRMKKSQNQGTPNNAFGAQSSSENGQRKSDHTICVPIASNGAATSAPDFKTDDILYCKNSACKAKMNGNDVFCKRCSCCICNQYDDNKDPSLWLSCNSEVPFYGMSCGLSCHLECALRHEDSGMPTDREDNGSLDGSFCCVSCGKENDLLGSWRKQLIVARDTRRVDILCYRLSLAQKILAGTQLYQNLCGCVDEAVEKLEQEVGPLTGLPVKKARGIVNRLSSGPEIQRLCASAVESLDLMIGEKASNTPSDCTALASKFVRIEDIRSSSLTVILNYKDSDIENVEGYMLWHRKADDTNYPSEPTCRLFAPNTKFMLSGLTPKTDYLLKVVTLDKDTEAGICETQFTTKKSENRSQKNPNSNSLEVESSQSPATNCSSLSNPSSVEDETNNATPRCSNDENREDRLGSNNMDCLDDSHNVTNGHVEISLLDEEQVSGMPESNVVNCSEACLQITPYAENGKSENARKNKRKISGKGIAVIVSERDKEPQAGSSSKKRSGENGDKECNGIRDKDFEHYVKVIRWLECEGHIDTSFRQKFLTWYSLRATSQEVRIVKVFIDTFIKDPESLAGQLVDSFSDVVSNKRCPNVPPGFCLKLWH
ncbi:hypothetical protein OROGR_016977 [Orobanche gracilis]